MPLFDLKVQLFEDSLLKILAQLSCRTLKNVKSSHTISFRTEKFQEELSQGSQVEILRQHAKGSRPNKNLHIRYVPPPHPRL